MIYFQDPQVQIHLADIRDVLLELPEHSVDMICTSPPYWGLRSYKAPKSIWLLNPEAGNCQHEWGSEERWLHRGITQSRVQNMGSITSGKTLDTFCLKCGAWQGVLGSEPSIQLYISHLVGIFEQCKRVLKPTGSLWVNLADSMAGSGKASGQSIDQVSQKQATNFESANTMKIKGIPAKSLCAVPARFQISMIDAGWICRNVIIWQKESVMPESVRDRFTRDFEYFYFFTLNKKYFFERQFEPLTDAYIERAKYPRNPVLAWNQDPKKYLASYLNKYTELTINPLGRNMRSVWRINPSQQPASKKKDEVRHYAAYPTKLCTTPILACVPEQICTKCGLPRVKIYEDNNQTRTRAVGEGQDTLLGTQGRAGEIEVKEVGLSDCGCGAKFESGIVLDPFSGTGTTAVEARKLGRRAVLIDISEDYCKIAQNRLEAIPLPMGLRV